MVRSAGVRYGLAVLASIVSFSVSIWFFPHLQYTPTILFVAAVTLAAWAGGLGPGLLATGLCLAGIQYAIRGAPGISFLQQALSLLLFGALSALISFLSHGRRMAHASEMRQHEKWQVALASIGDAVIVTNLRGNIEFMNSAAERLTGWAFADVRDGPIESIMILINEETRHPLRSPVRRVIDKGEPAGLENHTLLLARDGHEHPIDDCAAPIRDSRANLQGVIMVFRDIGARRQGERAISGLAAIVENSNDAILSKTLDGRILTWNPAAERLYGYTADEIVGQHVSILMPPHCREMLPEIMQKLSRGERIAHYETVRQAKSGQVVNVSVSISPVRDGQGNIVAAAAITRDITEQKRWESELTAARDAALESARLKSEFLANMSHEIRTPMNGMIGMLELLERTPLTPEQRRFARTIDSCADTLLKIINQILDYSKIEAGQVTLESVDFKLADIVDETIELLAPTAHQKGLCLIGHVDPGIPRRVRGDSARLQQILTNLISNAIKFTETGEVIVLVQPDQALPDGRVRLRVEVRDTGIGMGLDVTERLFQPFAQADGSTTRRFGGTGLGLVICRRLVDLMGGQIGVQSQPGHGSVFWLTVPLLDVASPADPFAMFTADAGECPVLIIDDNASERWYLGQKLATWGFPVRTAESGQEARRLLSRQDEGGVGYALVFLDWNLSIGAGPSLIAAIRGQRNSRCRLAMMATMEDWTRQEPGDRDRGDAWLIKPVRHSQLRQVIQAMMDEFSEAAEIVPAAPPPSATRFAGRVLVAEDNPINQQVIRMQLEAMGLEVEVVSNGSLALCALNKGVYDLVFLDCQMPEMDGYETARELRRRESGRHTPVIALTAHALKEDRDKCLAAGMDDYMAKPVREESLAAILQFWLSRSRTRPAALATGDYEDPFDFNLLARIRQVVIDQAGPEKYVEMIDDFMTSTRRRLAAVSAHSRDGRRDLICKEVHAIKGSAGSFGATRLSQLCQELETQVQHGAATETPQLLSRLETEFEQTCRILSREKAPPATDIPA